MGFGAILAKPMFCNFDAKLQNMGLASMAQNPIILRYHFGNFVR